jgi:hypothetical protein
MSGYQWEQGHRVVSSEPPFDNPEWTDEKLYQELAEAATFITEEVGPVRRAMDTDSRAIDGVATVSTTFLTAESPKE